MMANYRTFSIESQDPLTQVSTNSFNEDNSMPMTFSQHVATEGVQSDQNVRMEPDNQNNNIHESNTTLSKPIPNICQGDDEFKKESLFKSGKFLVFVLSALVFVLFTLLMVMLLFPFKERFGINAGTYKCIP